MTDLSKDAPQQDEDFWLVLLHEVTYWRELPEIQEDPGLYALADRSWNLLLEEERTEERNMVEVRSLLKQLISRVREKWLQQLACADATPPPPTGSGRRKKKRRRGKGEEAAPTIFLGACSLLPAWDDPAATRLTSPHPEKPPPMENYFYRPERLGHGRIRAVKDSIPRVSKALKGAAPSRPAPILAPVPDLLGGLRLGLKLTLKLETTEFAEIDEALERIRRKCGVIRAAITRLLTRIEEEVSKDQPDCDKLQEALSVLSVKEESLIDLDKGIEDETRRRRLKARWSIENALLSGRLVQADIFRKVGKPKVCRLTSLPPKATFSQSQATSLNREDVDRRWRYRHKLLNQFWTRWRKDYLMDLKSAHKCKTPAPASLRVGDVVLIGEDNLPRQIWKMGRITELFPGRDGLIRSCLVRTSSGNVLRRPVQLIYPLEIV
nr:uncharacterized protein LOC111856490 [Paramormyrops kingsleyae]